MEYRFFHIVLLVIIFEHLSFAQTENLIEGTLGIGVSSTSSRLEVNAAPGEDALKVAINSVLKLMVNENGGVAIGGPFITLPENGLYVFGNTGLGTTNPTAKLQINSNGSVSTPQLKLIEIDGSDFARIDFDNSPSNGRWTILGRSSMAEDTTMRFYHESFGDIMTLNANGWVGIGTSQPASYLHLNTTSDPDLKLFISENGNPAASLFYEGSAGTGTNNLVHLRSEINGATSNIMTWKLNGNVGIGISQPQSKLHIADGSNAGLAGGGYVTYGSTSDVNLAMDNDEIMVRDNGSIGLLQLQKDGGSIEVHTNESEIERVTILDDGKMGLGDSTPDAKLTINTPASSDPLRVRVDGSTKLRVHDNGSVSIGQSGEGPGNGLIVNGQLGLGGSFTTNGQILFGQKAVQVGSGVALAQLKNSTVTDDARVLTLGLGQSTPNNGAIYVGFVGGDGIFDGSVEATGTGQVNYNTTSDRRLKTSIKDVENGLEKVLAMQPRTYRFIAAPDVSEIGLIAQELIEVYPQVVSGSPSDPIEQPMMIDYGRLTPVLIAAIQELNGRINELEAELSALKK